MKIITTLLLLLLTACSDSVDLAPEQLTESPPDTLSEQVESTWGEKWGTLKWEK